MKTTLKALMSTTALVATLGLSPAAFAASHARFSNSVEVDGQIEMVKVGTARNDRMRQLGVVTPEGQVYLLTQARNDRAAFKTADRLAGRDDWAKVNGKLVKKDGTLALRVSQVSEE